MKYKDFDENNFIIGIDFGNSTSTVSYFDFNQNAIDVVDASGGYGKFSIPTVVSYNLDSGDWVFGEYALLNKGFGNDIIIENIIDNLGKNISYTVNGKKITLTLVLSKFLEFLIESIKNINPNAILKGIVVSFSSNYNQSSVEEIKYAFILANLDKFLLKIANPGQCILRRYFYKNKIKEDKIALIDYGNKQFRLYIYQIDKDLKIKCIKTYYKDEIGQHRIYNIIKTLITKKFIEETGNRDISNVEQNQLDIFTYQHFDIIFNMQKLADVKLYYNFYYPPFQKLISKEEIFDIVSFFQQEINTFFEDFFENCEIKKIEISNVILSGGSNEMPFVNRFLQSKFTGTKIFNCNAKRIISDGACILACEELGSMPKLPIEIEDLSLIKNNIGILAKDCENTKFIPLVYKNTFIWDKPIKKIFNIDSFEPLNFDIIMESDNSSFNPIYSININLDEFFGRDLKTIRFTFFVYFKNVNEMVFTIEDFGFGELFPKTDFKHEFYINLKN